MGVGKGGGWVASSASFVEKSLSSGWVVPEVQGVVLAMIKSGVLKKAVLVLQS